MVFNKRASPSIRSFMAMLSLMRVVMVLSGSILFKRQMMSLVQMVQVLSPEVVKSKGVTDPSKRESASITLKRLAPGQKKNMYPPPPAPEILPPSAPAFRAAS